MALLKQSSTAQKLLFLMVANSDHITPVTGLTPTVTLCKNGAAFGAAAGAVTEVANGWYCVAGNATDTNTLGPLVLHATGTAADATDMYFDVVAFDPQNATSLGLSNLDAAITSRMASYTQPTGFLAATFPGGTIASTTNLASGTITNVSGSVGSVAAGIGGDVGGNVLGNVSGNVAGSVGSVTGTIGSISVAGLALLWQDAVAAHFTTNNSIGKALYIAAAPGAAGGHFIAGSNAATTEASHAITGNSTVGGDFVTTGTFRADVIQAVTAATFPVLNANTNVNMNGAISLGTITMGATTATDAGNDIRLGDTERTNIGTAIWAILSTALTTVGSIGKRLVDYVTGDTYARLGAPVNASISADIAEVEADVDLILAATAGTGPKAITIHATDGAVALGGVSVTVLDGSNVTQASGITNGSGNLVVNLLASTTYTINTYKNGYTSVPSSQTTSAGNGPQTLTTIALTIVPVPTPPVNPDLCTLFGYIYDSTGAAAKGVVVTATPVAKNNVTSPVVTSGGAILSFNPVVDTTDVNGFFSMDVVRTSGLSQFVSYVITSSNGQINRENVQIATGTLNANTL